MGQKLYVATPSGIRRTDNLPFESNTLFSSLTAAQNYARLNPTAYAGQILSVQMGNSMHIFQIQPDKSLVDLSATAITSAYFTPDDIKDGKLYVEMSMIPTGIVSPDNDFYCIMPDRITDTGVYVLDVEGIDIQGIWQVKA